VPSFERRRLERHVETEAIRTARQALQARPVDTAIELGVDDADPTRVVAEPQ
jgi:hypothetical protein